MNSAEECSMRMWAQSHLYQKPQRINSVLAAAFALIFLILGASQSASALPAFARKYGLRCSACHESWPMLNYFGQKFKDNGYQLMNDRDAPIWQNPGYWPVTFRITSDLASREHGQTSQVDTFRHERPRRAADHLVAVSISAVSTSTPAALWKRIFPSMCSLLPMPPPPFTLKPSWRGSTTSLAARG